MLDKVRKYLGWTTIEENVGAILDLEKLIQGNKVTAMELSGDFLPVISKLEGNIEAMDIFCDISKSETKKMEGMFMLEKLKDKLSGIKSDYYSKIGELRKSNKGFKGKISHLMVKKPTNEAITLFKHKESLEKAFNHVTDEFLKGNVGDEVYSRSFITFKEKFEGNIKDFTCFETIQKAFDEGQITQDLFEKAAKTAQEKKVAQVMREFKAGSLKSSSGGKVTDKDQAIAIAMSEAGLNKSENTETEPTEAQKKAGNYKKEKRKLRGLTVSIENKKGSKRSGKNEKGESWEVTMKNDYGYFNRSLGKDGDHVDVFLSDKPEEGNIFVIDQSNDKGKFDEHKVMMGFKTEADALKNYKSNYKKNFDVKYSGITEVSEENFKKWLNTTDGKFKQKRKPFSELKKSNNISQDHLKEMISEHERLIKILAPLAGKYPKVKKEFEIQVKELQGYKKKLEKSEYEDVLLDPDYLEKGEGHKYIRREGSPGNWKYIYEEKDGDKKEIPTPVGEEISLSVKGLNIVQYSDKAFSIGGDTYANLELMRSIKKVTGVGRYLGKLKAWMFPNSVKEQVLGIIYSDVKNKGEDEKAQAIQNQKNELNKGTEVNVKGIDGKIEEGASDSDGVKYNIKTKDGTELNGVDEKVVETNPELDDKKIAETFNNSTAEGRVKAEKELYGVKPVEDIHNYSLREYLGMHGLSDEDVQSVIDAFTKKETKDKAQKKVSTGGVSKKSSKDKIEGLTKKQLISKLVYAHYQAVKDAIEKGENVEAKAVALYPDLKAVLGKKRQAMSEETKRKISEALKKDKTEDVKDAVAKKTAQEFIDSMSKKDLDDIKDSFSKAKNEFIEKEQAKLAKLIIEHAAVDKSKYTLYAKSREVDDYTEQNKIRKEARLEGDKAEKLSEGVQAQKNKVQAIVNGGDFTTLSDKVGVEHKEMPDFTNVDVSNISYDIDNILVTDKPVYIPEINEEEFASHSYIFDTIRVGKDKYVLSTNGYKEKTINRDADYGHTEGPYDPESGGYVVLTLDQLVLTQDYYTTKAKAKLKEKADKANERELEHWNKMSDKRKESFLMQRSMYHSIPAKIKKKITIDQWDKMTWQEREKQYKPIKKHGVKRLKTRFDDRHMAGSFHSMYERFVDPKAMKRDKDGKTYPRGERVKYGTTYASPEGMTSWKDFRQMLDWKINDINIQREEISGIREKAIETSYGNIGTNDILQKEYGILVKRQNGDEIKPQEVEQVRLAWEDVQKSFGNLKENATDDNLKISHAGKTHMFASKAIGIYIPTRKTIGVTAKYGNDQLGFTMGHETAHWIDHTLGMKSGKRHASDNYESTAGQIAITFRKNMNAQSSSNYINATHECFARAMEQYHAIELKGENALIANTKKYITDDSYVSKEVYEKDIKPLVEKFLKENKTFLKSLGVFDYFSNDNFEKGKSGVYADNPTNKRLNRVGQKYGSKAQEEVPEGKKTAKKEESKDGKKQSIDEQAKTASGSSLETASKESKDPEVRTAAHNELERREKEEKPQKEEETGGKKEGEKVEEKETEPKDEFDEHRKGFEDFSNVNVKELDAFYEKDSKKSEKYLQENFMQEKALDVYTEDGYEDIREFLTTGEVEERTTDLKGGFQFKINKTTANTVVDSISDFIGKNKITQNTSLNRRVKGDGAKFFKSLSVGDTYADKSFSSTSLKELKTFGDFNIEILAKKGSNVANVVNGSEYEYLMDKDSKFKVLGKSDAGIIVELL